MTARSRLAARWLVSVVLVASAALAGCSAHKTEAEKPCRHICKGDIDGAAYSMLVPSSWNGTLLIYSHGYRTDKGTGPGLPLLTQTDLEGNGRDALTAQLLAKGYALAGSSFSSAGWVVPSAIRSVEQLRARFTDVVGAPKRTYVWGSSMGGLVTELLAERASWVDGAVPMCGVVAGPNATFDNFLAAAVAVKALLLPGLPLAGYASADDAQRQADAVRTAIRAAATSGRKAEWAKLVYIGALVGIPKTSQNFRGNTQESRVDAVAQGLAEYVQFGINARPDLEHRFGGNPSRPPFTEPQLASADAQAVRALGGDVDALSAAVATTATSVKMDAAARAKLAASGEPTGNLRVPVVTMHTVYDPLALVAQEAALRAKVADAGKSTSLAQVFIAPPAKYDAATGPSYGISHCWFTPGQMVGAMTALDDWVRHGSKPSADELGSDVGPGVDARFVPRAWPTAGR